MRGHVIRCIEGLYLRDVHPYYLESGISID